MNRHRLQALLFLAEQVHDLVEKVFPHRVGLFAADPRKFLQKFLLSLVQIRRGLHPDDHQLIAPAIPLKDRNPLAAKRKTLPDWVPSGIFRFTLPSRVGTSISQPRAAWTKLIGISQMTSLFSRVKTECSSHVDGDVEIAVRSALRPLAPLHRKASACCRSQHPRESLPTWFFCPVTCRRRGRSGRDFHDLALRRCSGCRSC